MLEKVRLLRIGCCRRKEIKREKSHLHLPLPKRTGWKAIATAMKAKKRVTIRRDMMIDADDSGYRITA